MKSILNSVSQESNSYCQNEVFSENIFTLILDMLSNREKALWKDSSEKNL